MTEIRDDYKAFLQLYNGVFKGKNRPSKIALRYQLSVMELDDGQRMLIPDVADILYNPNMTRDEKIIGISEKICGNLLKYKGKDYFLNCDSDEDLLAIIEATDGLIEDVKNDALLDIDNQQPELADIDDTLLNAVVNMNISPVPLPISSIEPTKYKPITTGNEMIKVKPTNSYNAYRYDEKTKIPYQPNLPPGMALIENQDYPIRKSQLGEQPNPLYTQPQNIYNLVRRPEITYTPRPATLPINSYVFNPASGSSGTSGSSGSPMIQKQQVKTATTTSKKTVKKAPKNTLQNKIKKVRTRCRTQKKVKNPRKPTVQKKDCKKINDTISMIKNIKL